MTTSFSSSLALTLALILGLAGGAVAATSTLTPVADNTIYDGVDPVTGDDYRSNTCGAGINSFSGVTADGLIRRALMKFDIAGTIPAGSIINSVTLTIDVNRSGDNADAEMTLHRLERQWGEGVVDCSERGGGFGSPAGTGDATWLDAEYTQVAWSSSGGDYAAASATALIPTRGDGVWFSGDSGNASMVSDVQSWLDSPGGDHGWLIKIVDEGRASSTRRFNTREGGISPTLEVDFTPTGDVYACCFDDGSCTVTDTVSCTDQGGTPDTNTSNCEPTPCPQPSGACCYPDESCADGVARDECLADGGTFQGSGSTCADGNVDCGLTPFVDPLPIPAVLQAVGTRTDGVPQYEVTMTEEKQVLHAELPATDVWTYNGTFPGPTIEARKGEPIEVKYINSLPNNGNRRGGHYLEVDECAHGPNYWRDTARTVVHLHGGHVPARVDGNPEFDFMPGEFDTYEYPNNQDSATLWYHDHALGITRLNVYMGMAAFYLIRDDFEDGLGLPSGEYEIPIVLQDREFNPDGTFFYPPTLQDAFFGDRLVVNGKVWPYLDVKQGKYRFRMLNGSQARNYQLRLENQTPGAEGDVIPFQLIGTDGGLIDAPRRLDGFFMAPAERFDVVVDFGSLPVGTEIVLRNDDPAGPRISNVMKFIVGSETGHTNDLPATLRPFTQLTEHNHLVTRRFLLERIAEPCAGGEWVIRSLDESGAVIGTHWDDLTEFPVLGTTEIWEFENISNMMHPMHVHLDFFQVLDRTVSGVGEELELWETETWKDTVRVPADSVVRIIMEFKDYAGRFPYHCHILDHEDHEMMRQFQSTNDPVLCNEDGICDPDEDCISCPQDCLVVSGARCGNGLCETGDGENFDTCPADCAGKTKGKDPYKCGNPDDGDPGEYTDDDPRCTTGSFFLRKMPRLDACCGDGLCEGEETEGSCPSDCASGGAPPCEPTSNSERDRRGECVDGLDNDCDGLIDAEDDDCPGGGDCTPTGETETVCDDGVDDDCDGLIDGDDPDCEAGCTPTETPESSCGDGVDNDCDGAIDCADEDCAGDPACETVDCSTIEDRDSCRAEPDCRWDNRSGTCVNR